MSCGLSYRRWKLQQLATLALRQPLRNLAKTLRNIEFDYFCHTSSEILLSLLQPGRRHAGFQIDFYEKLPISRRQGRFKALIDSTCSALFGHRRGNVRRSGFWQVTCFCSRGMRNSMLEPAVRTESDQYLTAVDRQTAVRKLQDVLSLRLPSFYRCAFRVLGNVADAEDAVQEALLAAYKHINQFRGQSQMSTWLTTIVRNCALMQLRKRARHIHFPLEQLLGEEQPRSLWEDPADERPNPEDECRNSELRARLRKCTALLSPTLRRTFQLRVIDGLTILETARILGVPHGTVKAQLARARAKLSRHMRRVHARSSRKLNSTSKKHLG